MFRHRHHEGVPGAEEGHGAIHGLADQALSAEDFKKLFGVLGPAERPETGPFASRDDDCVSVPFHIKSFYHKLCALQSVSCVLA